MSGTIEAAGSNNFFFRSDTTDSGIFDLVFTKNEYNLPRKFRAGSVIIDIGCHIGSFAAAALERGASHVFSYEAFEDNYKVARLNLKRYEARAHLFNLAVGRSDGGQDELRCGGFGDTAEGSVNTGGVAVIFEKQGPLLPSIPFDEVLVHALEVGGSKRIELLKIDCEGSEWPILFTSEKLHLVNRICGEFHELGGDYDNSPSPFQGLPYSCEAKSLERFLSQQGFACMCIRNHDASGRQTQYGLIFAVKRSPSLPYLRFILFKRPLARLRKAFSLYGRRLLTKITKRAS